MSRDMMSSTDYRDKTAAAVMKAIIQEWTGESDGYSLTNLRALEICDASTLVAAMLSSAGAGLPERKRCAGNR